MKILALELSSGWGSISMLEDKTELFASEFANDRKHSGKFFENLERGLNEFGNPARIVVGLGPGSYAGTRIAIATAAGMQAALGCELIGVPSFRALAVDAKEFVTIGDARRESFWFARVRDRKCRSAPKLCSRAEIASLSGPIFTSEPLLEFSDVPLAYPSAKILATIRDDLVSPPLEPIYLREPHITQPKK